MQSYGKLYAIGHRAVRDLFQGRVVIQEKIDGSQISFGNYGGTLMVRSKGAEINVDAPDKMFSKAVETIKTLALVDGWTYRGEYLQKPKHNVLAYDRAPDKNIILFDVDCGNQDYCRPELLKEIGSIMGLEVVPTLFEGQLDDENAETIMRLLETTSVLGGQKIEGVVVKNYDRYGEDKKCLMGKFVSEAFKEKHKVDWKESNPQQGDVLTKLCEAYKTDARLDKAIIHLREKGVLEGSPKDIGALIIETKNDLKLECEDEIKEELFKWAWPKISSAVAGRMPAYYKEKLLKEAF